MLSTGGGTLADIERAVETILPINDQLCVLQCTAAYPAATEDLNLNVITTLRDRLTIVHVTHNMQYAARLSDSTAFMLSGELVEFRPTTELFTRPKDQRTEDYITGRFG